MKKLNKYIGIINAIALMMCATGFKINAPENIRNKRTVATYMAGFNAGDHHKILSCLTDDIVWEMPGVYQHLGKQAFDKEIENDAFTGRPTIKIIRMVEEADIVVAEGTVQGKKKDGELFNAVFCDVFHMENGKIRKLTSYLMFKK